MLGLFCIMVAIVLLLIVWGVWEMLRPLPPHLPRRTRCPACGVWASLGPEEHAQCEHCDYVLRHPQGKTGPAPGWLRNPNSKDSE